jgi:hypothetical protein
MGMGCIVRSMDSQSSYTEMGLLAISAHVEDRDDGGIDVVLLLSQKDVESGLTVSSTLSANEAYKVATALLQGAQTITEVQETVDRLGPEGLREIQELYSMYFDSEDDEDSEDSEDD